MKRHRGRRISITGTIQNLSWHRLESIPKSPWRLEFVLIPDPGQAIASSIDCTAPGAVASMDRQLWENGLRIQVEGHCQGGANGHTQVLVVQFAGRAHE